MHVHGHVLFTERSNRKGRNSNSIPVSKHRKGCRRRSRPEFGVQSCTRHYGRWQTAIPYGTIVNAKVVNAKKSSWWGTRGRLSASISEIVMPDGTVIPIQNGNFEIKGKNRTALSVILFCFVTIPACFITGSKAELQAGYEVVANVASNITLKVG